MYQLQVAQIVLFVLVGFALPAVGMIGLAWLLQTVFGFHTPNPIKNQPYECGMQPLQEAHIQFDIRYYLYALLFIVFDIEIVFIIPWALTTGYIKELFACPWLGPIEMTVFLLILVVGLAYAWAKGALKWE
ncbi:MAG: NADH-quinone oxidoreductase subunit A [Candidatus Melainabacteria bacterium]|nr:NADH-quinone oxidoreductase subunit A [Candidatus Melainabacteria bacterium]